MISICQMDLLKDFQDTDHRWKAKAPLDTRRAKTGHDNSALLVFAEYYNLTHYLPF